MILHRFWRILYDFIWFSMDLGWKINENRCKINGNQWKSMKINVKLSFFRICGVLYVDFDESYAHLSSFCMILYKFWMILYMIFNDFGWTNATSSHVVYDVAAVRVHQRSWEHSWWYCCGAGLLRRSLNLLRSNYCGDLVVVGAQLHLLLLLYFAAHLICKILCSVWV